VASARPRIHDTGEGPAIVLLHAFPQDASMWDHQVAGLSGDHRCLRPDAFGCGASPPPPAGLDMPAWADAVLAALDDAGVDGFALCGLSMGGYLAFALLRRAPERIRALALMSTRATPDTDSARADRLAMAATMHAGDAGAVAALVEPMTARLLSPRAAGEFHISDPVRGRIRRCTPAGIAACQEVMAGRGDSTDLLTEIRVPVLVVSGSEDAITPPDEMRGMAAAIPGARYELLEGAGHLVNLERPHRVTALLREFLDSS
jgi:pimeloyl-ACP methyl ester carboxylesterase